MGIVAGSCGIITAVDGFIGAFLQGVQACHVIDAVADGKGLLDLVRIAHRDQAARGK